MNEKELCRICANVANATNCENLFGRSQRTLLRQIEELTGLQLKCADNLPLLICEPCQNQAEQAHDFREHCIRVQQNFARAEYQNECEKTMEKEVHIVSNEIDNGEEEDYNENEDELMPVEELLVKIETTNADNEFQEDLNDFDSMDENEQSKIESATTTTIEISTVPRQNLIEHTKTNLYCEQCDKHFKTGRYLKKHLLRHADLKRFQCEQCPKNFFTNEDLLTHLRSHSRKKPYPCRYCDSHFRSASSRVVHERKHTNELPYDCTKCHMGFTNSTQLKNHLRSHENKRPFECKICNVSFNFKKVLTGHFLSRIHNENEEKLKREELVKSTLPEEEDKDWW